MDDRQDAALKRAFQKAVKAHDKRDAALMIEANMEFRDVWLGAVQNARLQDTIRRFTDHAQQVRLGTLSDPGTQKIVVDGMRALLEGFLERDPRKIKTAMLAFIVNAEQQYFALLGGHD
ncbi:FCD domain-containing protein [Achromobacter xylosoxidans]